MAVEIGALRALLSLDSAAFEKGVKRAQASMGNLERRFAQTGRKMQSIGKRLSTNITAPIVAATALMVRSSTQAAVEIERLSQVANTGVVGFQRFAAGAKDVGIEQEKVADILKDVNDRVGDFLTTGGGPMADFFEQIAPKVGVTADQFARLSGPEALQLYVSSLEKAGASQQEMTFFMEAMASDATLLLPLLRNNGAEMSRLGDRAEELGAVMDEKTVTALNNAHDSMRELGIAGAGISNRITAALAPAIEFLAEKLAAASQWFSKLSPQMQSMIGIAAAVAAAIGPITFALGLMVSGLAAAVGGAGALVAALTTLKGAMIATGVGALVVGLGTLIDFMFRLREATGSWGETLSGVFNVAKSVFLGVGNTAWGLSEIMAGVASAITGSFVRAFAEIAKSWDALVNGMATAWNAIADTALGEQLGLGSLGRSDVSGTLGGLADSLFDGAVSSITRGGERIKAAGKGVSEAIGDLKEALNTQTSETTESADAARGLAAALNGIGGGGDGAGGGAAKKAAKGLTEAEKALEKLKKKSEQTADRFGDMVAGIVTGSQSVGDALKSIGNQLISSGISGLASNFFKSSGFGDIFAGLFDNGGMIPAGQFGIAGERGPEIVTGPARVTSRVDTARMMGGAAPPPRVEVVARVENGNIIQTVRQVAGDVAVQVVSDGLAEYDRSTLPGSVSRINDDPRRVG